MTHMHKGKGGRYTDSRQVEQPMKGNGEEASEMDGVNKHGLMVPFMMETGRITEHMDKENSHILMEMFMKATG